MRIQIDHFGLIARFYDKIFRLPEADPLRVLLDPQEGDLVLDVGGGTGRRAAAFGDSGAQLVICDRSFAMLEHARQKGLDAVQASADRLPFASGSVSKAMLIDSLHHFVAPDPRVAQPNAVAELVRVLSTKGKALIEEPDIRRLSGRLVFWMERALFMGSRFLTAEELAAVIVAAGAQAELVASDGFSYRTLVTIPAAPASDEGR